MHSKIYNFILLSGTSSPYTQPRRTRPKQAARFYPKFRWVYTLKSTSFSCIHLCLLCDPLSEMCPTFVRSVYPLFQSVSLEKSLSTSPHRGTFRMKTSDKNWYMSYNSSGPQSRQRWVYEIVCGLRRVYPPEFRTTSGNLFRPCAPRQRVGEDVPER